MICSGWIPSSKSSPSVQCVRIICFFCFRHSCNSRASFSCKASALWGAGWEKVISKIKKVITCCWQWFHSLIFLSSAPQCSECFHFCLFLCRVECRHFPGMLLFNDINGCIVSVNNPKIQIIINKPSFYFKASLFFTKKLLALFISIFFLGYLLMRDFMTFMCFQSPLYCFNSLSPLWHREWGVWWLGSVWSADWHTGNVRLKACSDSSPHLAYSFMLLSVRIYTLSWCRQFFTRITVLLNYPLKPFLLLSLDSCLCFCPHRLHLSEHSEVT